MKKISIIAAFLLVAATTTLAMAGPGRMGFGGGRHMSPSMMAALELTNEQTEKIQALHKSATQKMTPIKAQFATKRAEMRLLWTQTTLDVDKIKAMQKELQALGTQIRDTQTDMRIAFRNLLTPEQTLKLLAMGFGKGDRNGKRKGHGKGGNQSGRGQGNMK